jgi:DNA-directed RNA polymerase subunit M/transcription elongation factor TFIIS
MRISCPNCGNDTDFYEVAEEVTITTSYVQNEDGSFTSINDRSEILGEVRFYCGECHQEMSQFHDRFLQMLF